MATIKGLSVLIFAIGVFVSCDMAAARKCVKGRRSNVPLLSELTVRPGFGASKTTDGAQIKITVQPEDGGESCTTPPLNVEDLQDEQSVNIDDISALGDCAQFPVKDMKLKIDIEAVGKSVAGISIVEATFSDGSLRYCSRGTSDMLIFGKRPAKGLSCPETHGGARSNYKYQQEDEPEDEAEGRSYHKYQEEDEPEGLYHEPEGQYYHKRRSDNVPQLSELTVRPGFSASKTTKGAKIKITVKPEDGASCTTEPLDVSDLKEEQPANIDDISALGDCAQFPVKEMKMKIDIEAVGKSVAGISIVEATFSDGSLRYCSRGTSDMLIFGRRPAKGLSCPEIHGGARSYHKYQQEDEFKDEPEYQEEDEFEDEPEYQEEDEPEYQEDEPEPVDEEDEFEDEPEYQKEDEPEYQEDEPEPVDEENEPEDEPDY